MKKRLFIIVCLLSLCFLLGSCGADDAPTEEDRIKAVYEVQRPSDGITSTSYESWLSSVTLSDGFIFETGDGENRLVGYYGTDERVILPESFEGEDYTVASFAFATNNGFSFITVPSGAAVIEENAFLGCTSLVSVTLLGDEKTIGQFAFSSCYKLVEVINKTPLSIAVGDGIMQNGGIAEYAIAVHSGESMIEKADGFLFLTVDDRSLLVDYAGVGECVTLPKDYLGAPYALSEYALAYEKGITSLTIPEGIEDIEDAKLLRSSLNEVKLPSDITRIGGIMFRGCALRSVVIPDSVRIIEGGAFMECESLVSVTLGQGVLEIGENAFFYCLRLAEVVNHSSLDIQIGSKKNGRISLNAVAIHKGESGIYFDNGLIFLDTGSICHLIGTTSDTVKFRLPESFHGKGYSIGRYAFAGRDDIEEIVFPDSVTSIGERAFWQCSALREVSFGKNLSGIDKQAFAGCENLIKATLKNTSRWWHADSGWVAIGPPLLKEELDDPKTVASYLKAQYSNKYWRRSE